MASAMFKVMGGARGVSHVQGDGRGTRSVSHVQGDGKGEGREPCTRLVIHTPSLDCIYISF